MTTPETTVTDISETLGVTRQTVWLWLKAKGRPSYTQMLRLRDEFGVPLDEWEEEGERP